MTQRIDAHQHFWRIARGDCAWLRPDEPLLAPLYRDFLPEDLQAARLAHGIAQTVLVQAAASEAETDFLLELADANPWIAGVIGWVDLSQEAAIDRLSQWCRHPKFKGVRPMLQDLPEDDWIVQAARPRVIQALIAFGLRFDALVRPAQLPGLLAFVRRYPDLPVVIDHAAKPPIGEPARPQETAFWHAHMAALAAMPQVMCKFSGLLTETTAAPEESLTATLEKLRPVWDELLRWFGPSRLMWGSDWPVLTLQASIDRWVAASESLIGELPPAEQREVWQGSARRFYGLTPRLGRLEARNMIPAARLHTVTQPAPALISISRLCKSFAGVRALDDCQLELLPGEVHALMGENGAGKSTLMKVLAGVYPKDSGEVLIDGKPVEIDSPRQAQSLGIGIVHQELNLMQHLSAAQNIFIGREPRRARGLWLDEDRLNADARRLFARMNLDLDPRTPVSELTVARQQMVEIAKALSFDSRVLILDEPTAALNEAEVADLFLLIRQLKAQGVGLVYISHRMDELRRIADRVTVMRDGKYIGTVPMAGTSVEAIVSMMVGRQLDGAVNHSPDTSRNPVALEVRGLNRGKAVRDVAFHVRRGEILGFAGLMGAGRTEVARAVFGADRIDSGELIVHGKRVKVGSPREAVAQGIGYLSEDRKHFGLATGLDVEANIVMSCLRRFVRRSGRIDTGRTRAEAGRLVGLLRIKTPSLDQQVARLSGGNQQKIVIAKWLLRDCDILFFDEPTRGIDVGAKAEIHKLINGLAEQGKAIVMISSELPEVLSMSHRIVVMCEGRITGELDGRSATPEAIMQLATRREPIAA